MGKEIVPRRTPIKFDRQQKFPSSFDGKEAKDPEPKCYSMVFRNVIDKRSLHATIRLGYKWQSKLSIGDIFKIVNTSGTCLGAGEVCGILCCKLSEIQFGIIDMTPYITFTDMVESMKENYGHDKNYLVQNVTIIFFKLHEPDQDEFF